MEEKYKLLSMVLNKLQEAGALEKLVLAGSWCQYYYSNSRLYPECPKTAK